MDDVFVEEGGMESQQRLAVAKVNTKKSRSNVVNLAHELEIRGVDDNIFIIQMFCLATEKDDVAGVVDFLGLMVLIEECDGRVALESVKLERLWFELK